MATQSLRTIAIAHRVIDNVNKFEKIEDMEEKMVLDAIFGNYYY